MRRFGSVMAIVGMVMSFMAISAGPSNAATANKCTSSAEYFAKESGTTVGVLVIDCNHKESAIRVRGRSCDTTPVAPTWLSATTLQSAQA